MLRVILVALLVVLLAPFALRGLVVLWGSARAKTIAEAPSRRVAIVFGASVYRSGRPSAMLYDRVAAAAELYQAGKVDVLLMTGDGGRPSYNEPEPMRDAAIALGIPEDDIVLDYGGLRTYDSCYRARYIFGVEEAVLVTQDFHLPRALMLCRAMCIDPVGVAADEMRPSGYSQASLSYSRVREIPATVVAAVEAVRHPLPPMLGEPLPIFPREAVD
jgi:SanA protein